jgi:predicted aspartyl protease
MVQELDLRSCFGGPAFVFECIVYFNGLAIKLKVLIDTGANGYAFINRRRAEQLRQLFPHVERRLLPHTAVATGYKDGKEEDITHATLLHMELDGRQEYNVPFLEVSLGHHDIILGRSWLAHNDVNPDCKRHRLNWPSERPREQAMQRRVIVDSPATQEISLIRSIYQQDVLKREAAMEKEDKRRGDGQQSQGIRMLRRVQQAKPETDMYKLQTHHQSTPFQPLASQSSDGRNSTPLPSQPPASTKVTPNDHESVTGQEEDSDSDAGCSELSDFSDDEEEELPTLRNESFKWDRAEGYRKMDAEVKRVVHRTQIAALEFGRRQQAKEATIDLFLVNAEGFRLNLKNENAIAGSISLFEIDRAINEQLQDHTKDPQIQHEERLKLALASIDGRLPEDEAPATRVLIAQKLPKEHQAFVDVFSEADSNRLAEHKAGVDHIIELDDPKIVPGFCPLYNMSLEELLFIKDWLLKNMDSGFIETSSSPFASPILIVKKPTPPGEKQKFRFCIDYRKLNALTKKDRYPIPLIAETLTRLAKAKVFTKLDIRQAFHRIRMDPNSEDLTTFRTRYGSFKCKIMMEGLANGPATWQRYMNTVLMDYLDDFCTAYLDDILIYSDDPLEHTGHVHLVLERLRSAGLQADIKKSEFNVTETKYLGFIISTTGIRVDPDKVAAVKHWKQPRTVKQIQSFIGFCNFYRRFIRSFGRMARPLIRLTRKNVSFDFNEDCIDAFEKLKEALVTAPVLALYDPHAETRMETDASDGVVAGTLSQKSKDDEWHPIAFYSKTMDVAEMNYEIHDKEMLALIRGLEEWSGELRGVQLPFIAITDHRALEYFTTKRLLRPRQARWADLISEYNFKIVYRPGKENVIADALSRKAEELRTQKEIANAGRTMQLIKDEQVGVSLNNLNLEKDQLLLIEQLLQVNRTSESLQGFRSSAIEGHQHLRIEDGLLLYQGRLFVPEDDQLRTKLLYEIHATLPAAHPGRNKTRVIAARQFYWPRMNSDIDIFVAACQSCRRASTPRDKTPGLLKPLPIPERPWQHISMDFMSFNKDRHGYDNVFVVVDRLGKRPFSLPCYKTAKAKDAAWLYYEHIYRIYGLPDTIVSDRGPQFISAFTNELTLLLGIKFQLSTAEHAQTDGQTEIVNQALQQRLRHFVNHYQDNWSELLPAMDFAAATAPHESTGLAPSEVEMGFIPRMHYDWNRRNIKEGQSSMEKLNRQEAQQYATRMHDAWQFARQNLLKAQERQSMQANKKRRPEDFDVGDLAYVTKKSWRTDRPCDKLDNPVAGPFRIIGKKHHSWVIDLPPSYKIHNVFHSDRLRKAAENASPGQLNENDPDASYEIDGNIEWEVDRILGSRIHRNKLQYMVEWRGWDPDNTWYDAESFKNSPTLLRLYHVDNPDKDGPPVRLQQWQDAFDRDEADLPHEMDNAAVSKPRASKMRTRNTRR